MNKVFLMLNSNWFKIVKSIFFYSFVLMILLSCKKPEFNKSMLKDGDLIFQTSNSGQSKAIQAATDSKYSHIGIILFKGGEPYVYEAIGPVVITPIQEFISRGNDQHFVIKRLKDSQRILKAKVISKMKKLSGKYLGIPYDTFFEWSNKKMYCSELVWKLYKQGAGCELAKLQKLEEFNLDNDMVKKDLKKRYGKNIPIKELCISPGCIFNSSKLETIFEN